MQMISGTGQPYIEGIQTFTSYLDMSSLFASCFSCFDIQIVTDNQLVQLARVCYIDCKIDITIR